MRLTKKRMVQEIFFFATEGQRTGDNFAPGLFVIEAIAQNNYLSFIRERYDMLGKVNDKKTCARLQLRRLVDQTARNLGGETGRAVRFKDACGLFGF